MDPKISPKAIRKARSRFNTAKAAWEDLETCTKFERFSELWYTFLVSSKGVYICLEQGAKQSPQGKQWFGAISAKRRGDPLLQYLFQARDDDEHGLNEVIANDRTGVSFLFDDKGVTKRMTIRGNYTTPPTPETSMDITSVNGIPITPDRKLPYVRLIRVHGRDGKPYDPPTAHLGNQITTDSPLAVGWFALVFLQSIIEEAASLA